MVEETEIQGILNYVWSDIMKKLLTTFLALTLLTACASQPVVVDETTISA